MKAKNRKRGNALSLSSGYLNQPLSGGCLNQQLPSAHEFLPSKTGLQLPKFDSQAERKNNNNNKELIQVGTDFPINLEQFVSTISLVI